jgi:Ca-activated chloride channel family protein
MILADPWFLLLLAPLAALLLWRLRARRPALDGGSEQVLGALPATWRTRTTWLPGALGALAGALLIVALARPLQGREESRVLTEGIDIMLVVDTSSSMLDDGMQPGVTNLELVKQVVADFAKGRKDDRVGLTTFAVYPRTECPLTLDMGGLLARIGDIKCVRVNSEEDGTAIGVGLAQAARKLKDSDAKSKVVVLLTDGAENRHTIEPLEAAKLCQSLGIKVYTIGAGRPTQRDMTSRLHELQVDFTLLEQVAQETGGKFWRAKDAETLASVYREIDQLERSRREDVRYTDYDEFYPWLLLPAALLLVAELLLRRGPYLEFAS